MKKEILIVSLAMCCLCAQVHAKDLKVLMIGNSFSVCVQRNLPQIVYVASEHSLKLTSAYIGGCSLETHWKHIEALEANPQAAEHKNAYWITVYDSQKPNKPVKQGHGNVNELLVAEPWDVITIQQASHLSWQEESYYPFGDNLLEYIRKKAPQARVVVQQTWAYRADDARICPLHQQTWKIDQRKMYQRLENAYHVFANKHGLPVIPMGYAVELTRQNDERKFEPLPLEEIARFRWPDLPPQASDPVGMCQWKKNAKGDLVLSIDPIHLNIRGEYLQACLWFQFLFGEPATEIVYEHPAISRQDCQFLRKMAQQAIENSPFL